MYDRRTTKGESLELGGDARPIRCVAIHVRDQSVHICLTDDV